MVLSKLGQVISVRRKCRESAKLSCGKDTDSLERHFENKPGWEKERMTEVAPGGFRRGL